MSAYAGDRTNPRSTVASAQEHKDVVSSKNEHQAPTGMDHETIDNISTQPTIGSPADAHRLPDTLMNHLALQTAVGRSERQGHSSMMHQIETDQLPEPLRPIRKSQRDEVRKRKADSPERVEREHRRRRYD